VTSPQAFAERYDFPLDRFQRDAIEALDQGSSVLVAAPTGAGKTVVAEYAIERAIDAGRKCFYTTPLKALSNQKFGDFVAVYGAPMVGLLTGDNTINGEAPIVVMTTEVLRNMLYERSDTLQGLQSVVMDEVHYLQDPYRGAVWEEVLIHLPASVAVACLSATISNAEEFGDWIGTLRGTTRVVIEEKRPVPLEHHYLVGRRLHPMHVEHQGVLVPNPYVVALDQQETRVRSAGRRQGGGGGGPRDGGRRPGRAWVPRREDVVEVLADAGMLPAIYFVFSRAGCDKSVRWLRDSGLALTTQEEAHRIRDRAEANAAWIEESDLDALGFGEFLDAAAAGIAAHHAGMLPVFKETVEELFEAGLIKVVFATETLSLGINMPAKTVVIEDLWKFQGERHELVTPGEYTQLTGRAGRRGIDALGHAVVVYQRQVPFERVAGLAATRTYDLSSSFRPSYNMAVNLVRNYTTEQAHQMLNSSFAQFLADRGVVALERSKERDKQALAGYRTNLECHLGDFEEYWALRRKAQRLRETDRKSHERERDQSVRSALAALRPGDVIAVPRARQGGSLAVVLAIRDGRPTVLTDDRSFFRLAAHDFAEPPRSLTRIQLPRSGSARSARYRRDVAASLTSLHVRAPRTGSQRAIDQAVERQAAELDAEANQHPCHGCPERRSHERWAERADKLHQQIRGVERRIKLRTETLARRFDRVLAVLDALGYVQGWHLTDKGRRLTRIYGEGDLLVGEALAAGVMDGLGASEVAALVSTVVYESRERTPLPGILPTDDLADAYERLQRLWRQIRRAEDAQEVQLCRELDPGFAGPVFAWAEGSALEDVLDETEMAPGDFVRNCKQLIDLLRQIEEVADPAVRAQAHAARTAVARGVVGYSGVSLQ
jgi:ATP-dependent RNA helicase HelY